MRFERWLGTMPLKIRSLFRRRQLDQELDEEIGYHLERKIAAYVAEGMAPEEARFAALRAFGGVEYRKEDLRDQRGAWGLGWLDSIWQDVRFGLRRLRKQPTFTSLAVLTLALGVGAATTIFSVIHSVLLDPFPYVDADRVVNVQIQDLAVGRSVGRTAFPLPEFLEYQAQSHVFDEVIGGGHEDILMTSGEGAEHFDGGFVTSNTFRFLGVPALVGRGLLPEDAKPGAPPVFVMAYKVWLSRYNLDPTIVGRSFVLNGVPTTLVGVMPPRFTKFAADVWRTVPLDRGNPDINRRAFRLQARLKPGLTLAQAEADLEPIARRLATIYPKNYPNRFVIRVVSWVDSLVVQFRTTLYTLAAAVGLLLLIACSNVANMLLAKATTREKEIAVRVSFGATRWRVIRQMLLESALLALCASAAGWLLAYVGIKSLVPLIPALLLPSEVVIGLNVPVLVFSLALTAVTALLFGSVPAMYAVRRDVVESLKDSSKSADVGSGRGRFRNGLVVVQVALSLVLLVGAGLLMRTLVALQRVDLGFNPDHVLAGRVPLPRGVYDTAAAKQRFFQALLQRLQAMPGVVAASAATGMAAFSWIAAGEVDVPGQAHSERWDAVYQLCSEGYFSTLGVRLARGRTLSNFDVNEAQKVAVVNQTLVNRYFGAANPIGRSIKLTMLQSLPKGAVDNPVFEIVGVIADVKNHGIQDPPMPEVLIPYTITGAFDRGILVKTVGEPGALINSVRREIWAVDRNVALTFTGTLTEYLNLFSYAEPRFTLLLLGVFAGLGLVLAVIGVYSVMTYTVSQRTRELGIRMALGAGRADLVWQVMAMGARLLLVGLVLGVLASFGVTRVISGQLWGVSPQDPSTLIGVVGVLVVAGLAACYLPARKATVIDPMVALRR
jgi:predicted permease